MSTQEFMLWALDVIEDAAHISTTLVEAEGGEVTEDMARGFMVGANSAMIVMLQRKVVVAEVEKMLRGQA